MKKFSKKFDNYAKVFLNESTNYQAEEAAKAFENLLRGKLPYVKSNIDDTMFYVGDAGNQIMIKVAGFKNEKTPAPVTAAPTNPAPAAPTAPVAAQEEEEDPINTDPNVIQAKMNAAQKVSQMLAQEKAKYAQKKPAVV